MAQAFLNAYNESIENWNTETIFLEVSHGFGVPIQIRINEYIPNKAIYDVFWKEPSGWQKLEHRPYGIMHHTQIDSSALDQYVRAQIPRILHQLDRDHFRGSTVFGDTMQILQEFLPTCSGTMYRVLEDAFTLWGYMHLQYHALWQFAPESSAADKLGMSELVLYSHDVETLTPFHGTVPLPRLLHQQIHACCEGRMRVLDKSVLQGLEAIYVGFRKACRTKPEDAVHEAVGMHLTTWLYLTILEELNWDANRWLNLLSVSSDVR